MFKILEVKIHAWVTIIVVYLIFKSLVDSTLFSHIKSTHCNIWVQNLVLADSCVSTNCCTGHKRELELHKLHKSTWTWLLPAEWMCHREQGSFYEYSFDVSLCRWARGRRRSFGCVSPLWTLRWSRRSRRSVSATRPKDSPSWTPSRPRSGGSRTSEKHLSTSAQKHPLQQLYEASLGQLTRLNKLEVTLWKLRRLVKIVTLNVKLLSSLTFDLSQKNFQRALGQNLVGRLLCFWFQMHFLLQWMNLLKHRQLTWIRTFSVSFEPSHLTP